MEKYFQNSQLANSKWGVLVVVIIGSFMPILDTTIVNVALPKIMANFGSTVDQIEWVVTAYMISFAIIMPAMNWLQKMFGLKSIFMTSLVVFCLGSALCGLAWDLDSMILFRIIQAIGGGAMMPTGLTLVSEAFPPQERGMALGVWSIGAMVAPTVGPFLGGYLVDEISWRWIFYINLPIGPAAMLAALWVLPARRLSQPYHRFDFLGFGSFSVFLAFLLIALTKGQREGWDSDTILTCFGLSFLGLSSYLISWSWIQEPLIDLRLLINRNFLLANIINFVRAVGIFGSLFLIPMFLQNLLQYSAWRTGIILAPSAISVAIVAPFSGFITDRIGPRLPLFLGTVLLAFSLYEYKDISLNSDYWFLLWPQLYRGIGLGLINAPLMSTALNAVRREHMGMASGLLTVIMQLGGSFGVAMLGTTLQRREFFHYAHYLELLNDTFSPFFARAQSTLQGLLLDFGYSPADAVSKGKSLLALWVHRQASASAFGDAFFFAGLLIAFGILPALLIRRNSWPGKAAPRGVSE